MELYNHMVASFFQVDSEGKRVRAVDVSVYPNFISNCTIIQEWLLRDGRADNLLPAQVVAALRQVNRVVATCVSNHVCK